MCSCSSRQTMREEKWTWVEFRWNSKPFIYSLRIHAHFRYIVPYIFAQRIKSKTIFTFGFIFIPKSKDVWHSWPCVVNLQEFFSTNGCAHWSICGDKFSMWDSKYISVNWQRLALGSLIYSDSKLNSISSFHPPRVNKNMNIFDLEFPHFNMLKYIKMYFIKVYLSQTKKVISWTLDFYISI